VLQNLEAGREVFELLAHLGPDPAALVSAGRTSLLLWRQVVLDLDPLQLLGQLLPAMLVAVLDAPSGQRLARFFGNAGLVQRQLVHDLAEEQQLTRIELLAPRAVITPQNRGHRRLHRRINACLHRRVDRRLTLLALDENQLLQQSNVVRQFINDKRHARLL